MNVEADSLTMVKRSFHKFLTALTAALFVCPAGFAQEEQLPILKPDTAKMDQVPAKEPLKGGVEHNSSGSPDQKVKKKKLKGNAGQSNFKGRSRAGGLLDNNRFNANADENRLEAQAERSIGIIGVRFVSMTGYPPVINTVFPGTPAATVGILPNDFIVAVDGVPTSGLSRDECYDLIIGTPNTPVTLSLRRGNSFFSRTMNRMDLNEMTDQRVRQAYLYHL